MWGFHVAKYCYVFVCIITPKTSTEKWTENRTPCWFYTGTRGPRTCAVFNQTSNIVISKTLDGTVATDGTAASGIYQNPYVKLQEWNIAVSKQSNVCWIGGISHQYLGKCISNDLLLCIHIPQSAHHETDSNSRIELDLFPIIDFGNWNRFPTLFSPHMKKPLSQCTTPGAGEHMAGEWQSLAWESFHTWPAVH